LSIFIELIAPICLLFFNILNSRKKPVRKNNKIKKDKEKITPDMIRHFSLMAWYSIRNQKKDHLTDRNTILKFAEKRNLKITEKVYYEIIKIALKHKLIKKENGVYKPISEFVDEEYFYRQISQLLGR
jgi:hypothetical protein